VNRRRTDRSRFSALSDSQRSDVREAAFTMAQMGLGRTRPQEGHPPGNVGGTYNTKKPGAEHSAGSTIPATQGASETMARVSREFGPARKHKRPSRRW
jgi:hypothetical protein